MKPLALVFLLPLVPASAATYYVDFASGADGRSGGSAAQAFRHCPGDAQAAGHAASTRLSAGDTVLFKGGVAYLGCIDCPADRVSYDGNSAGTFGHGRAILNGSHRAGGLHGFTATGRRGLKFTGFEVEGYGGHGDTPWSPGEKKGRYGYGLYLDGCSQIAVTHCLFQDIGDWRNEPNANEGIMEGVGISVIDSGRDITISDNEFTRIGRAAVMVEPKQGTRTCTAILIQRNDFHEYLRWGVWLSTGNTGCTLDGITIVDNQFHDFYQYGTDQWKGLPHDAPHVDCIIAYIGSLPPQGGQHLGTAEKPIAIVRNKFFNRARADRVQNAAVFLDTFGGRVIVSDNIFTNVLFHGNGAVFCLEGTDTSINPPPDYWIVRNRFYDTTYSVTLESERYPLKNGAVHVRDNIFCKTDAGPSYSVRVMDRNSAPAELDYDVYSTARSDGQLATVAGENETLAELRRRGYEQHGRQAD